MQTEKSGQEYLEQVLACLEKRLEEVNASIEAGVREIEDMHEYYWEIIQKWTSTDMRNLITDRLFWHR